MPMSDPNKHQTEPAEAPAKDDAPRESLASRLKPFVLILLFSGWAYYARFIGLLEGHLGPFKFITGNMFWLISEHTRVVW